MVHVVTLVLIVSCLVGLCSTAFTVEQKLAEIENRLKKYVESDRTRCQKTSWGSAYAELHQKLLSSPSGMRLVAVPHVSGIADRIVGFTTGLALAILTNRALQMGRREHLRGCEEAFEQPNFNWLRPPDEAWLVAPLMENASPNQYNQSVLDSKMYFAVNTIGNVTMEESLAFSNADELLGGSVITTMLVTNRGKTIRMFNNPVRRKRIEAMGLTAMTTFGCLVNYAIQPKKEIFLPVFDQFEKMSRADPKVLKISIQIRAGDHIWANNNNNNNNNNNGVPISHAEKDRELLHSFQRFFSCAEQIEAFARAAEPDKYSSALWYLATDSKALRHAAVAHYGEKVVTSLHSTLEHSAKESSVCVAGSGVDCSVSSNGFTSAAAEWWMLGYADYHVITLYSGFGRSGAYRTLEAERIYTINQKAIECTPKTFTEHGDMVFEWAGI